MSEVIKAEDRIAPVIIVKTGMMTGADIIRLRKNGFCVVESKDPSTIRFLEPAPQGYGVQQWAAIQLARTLLQKGILGSCNHRVTIGAMYADILLQSDPLQHVEKVKP